MNQLGSLLPLLVTLLLSTSLSAQLEDNWSVSLTTGAYGGFIVLSEEVQVTQTPASVTGGLDYSDRGEFGTIGQQITGEVRYAKSERVIMSGALSIAEAENTGYRVGSVTAVNPSNGRASRFVDLFGTATQTAISVELGANYRFTRPTGRLDWQLGGSLVYSFQRSRFTDAVLLDISRPSRPQVADTFAREASLRLGGIGGASRLAYRIVGPVGLVLDAKAILLLNSEDNEYGGGAYTLQAGVFVNIGGRERLN